MTRTPATVDTLRKAGWFEGRRVSVDELISPIRDSFGPLNHAAQDFLREFGGLTWPQAEPDVASGRCAFSFEPALALHEEDRFHDASDEFEEKIFPLGTIVDGHGFLGRGESGTYYFVMDFAFVYSDDTWATLTQLLGYE